MLLVLLFVILVTLVFFLLSQRFENSLKNKKFKPLTSFPLVSILIPAYKSESTIRNTLDSIRKSNYPNKEVIVVNDSKDRTPEICREYGFKVIQNKKREGKGPALNKAVKHAKGNFLLFLDSDTTMQKGTLKTLMKSFKGYEADGEKVGIVAPRFAAGNRRNLLAKFSDMEYSMHQNLLKVQMNFKSILSARGCCLLVNRQAFLDSGGFSRTILEDGDFNAKAVKAGYSIKYEPRALVRTKDPETYRELLKAKQRYGRGTFFCLLNHKRPYLTSIQSLVSFYPMFLIFLAFIGVLVFQDPFTMTPILLLLSIPMLQGLGTTTLLVSVALISLVGVFIGVNTSIAGQVKAGLLNTALPFILIFIPLVAAAYTKGFASGVIDRIKGRPELDFSKW